VWRRKAKQFGGAVWRRKVKQFGGVVWRRKAKQFGGARWICPNVQNNIRRISKCVLQKKVFTKIFLFFLICLVWSLKKVFTKLQCPNDFKFARIYFKRGGANALPCPTFPTPMHTSEHCVRRQTVVSLQEFYSFCGSASVVIIAPSKTNVLSRGPLPTVGKQCIYF